jgi:hypothetical protein
MPPRVKLYIYSNAKPHSHDLDPPFVNTVPLSQKGIQDHCDVVCPDEADYFYMGQFSDASKNEEMCAKNFMYWEKYPDRHIADIEGDWPNRKIPEHLKQSWLTINGVPSEMKDWPRLVIRPTFSKLFLQLIKSPPKFLAPNNRRFFFKGYPDPWGVRAKLYYVIQTSNLDADYVLTAKWNGHNDPENSVAKSYTSQMESGCFALCPRGVGHDSVRFFEACMFGRIPVVVGDNIIMGEEWGVDTSFAIKISQHESLLDIKKQLVQVSKMSGEEVYERASAARRYFTNTVLSYFQDPTMYFLEKLCIM